jgi:hypothetical protein
VQSERRFLGLRAIGNQSGDQVDQEVDQATVAGMLDLADVFELIIDGLGDGLLTQEKFVRSVEQTMTRLLAQRGDE